MNEGLPIFSAKQPRILIADDDKFYLKIYSDLVAEMGFDCMTVENGLEALEKFRKYDPDLLIIDVVMPGMSGWEVCRALRDDAGIDLGRRVSRRRGPAHSADRRRNAGPERGGRHAASVAGYRGGRASRPGPRRHPGDPRLDPPSQ